MNITTATSWEPREYPFRNTIGKNELLDTEIYKKVSAFLDRLWIRKLADFSVFFDEESSPQEFSKILENLWIDRDELRLLKQWLSNNLCQGIFQVFLERTAHIRSNPKMIPVFETSGRWEIEGMEIGWANKILWAHVRMWVFQILANQKNYKNHTHHVLSAAWRHQTTFYRFLVAKFATKIHIRYDYPIEFFVSFLAYSWHEIFQNIMWDYMDQNRDLALPYIFLEWILMEDLAYRNNGITTSSHIRYIIPNSNSKALLMFLKNKKGDISLEEIEKFLRQQRQLNIKESLSPQGVMLAKSRNMGSQKLWEDGCFHTIPIIEEDIPMPRLWWCPCAQVKTKGGKNAFLEMYTIFDDWFITMIKGLADNNLIRLSDYPKK